jgi:hypothetical protein
MPAWTPERRERHAATWRRIKAGEGFLYVIRVGERLVKIGFSTQPEKRAREQFAELAAKTPGTLLQEKAIHRALLKFRAGLNRETYPADVLDHPIIPAGLRAATRPKRRRPADGARRAA